MTIFRRRALRRPAGLVCALATALAANSGHAATTPSETAETPAPEAITVLGSRSAQRSVAQSSAPIDVIGAQTLAESGGYSTQLRDALAALVPSFKVDMGSNAAYNTFGRPAGLRGLSGAHVLVLVNGKRRHPTSIALPATSGAPGANAVDLDEIPQGAIDHIEILRDGAAAQYGSDAVAGVINIVLKKGTAGGLSVLGGARYPYNGKTDGDNEQLRIDHGFALPNNGFIHLSLDLQHQGYAFRTGLATVQIYPLVNGQPDPREATRDRHLARGGLAKVKALYSAYNAELPLGDVTLYSYGTFGIRGIWNGQTYRLPNSTSYIPQLYSDVIQPTGRFPDSDWQGLLGAKGSAHGWDWDVSSTFGRHHAYNGMEDTLNPSLGPSSPTSFHTFDSTFDQWVTNADVRRGVDLGLAQPLNIAFGTEFRHERYQTAVRDEASYANGGYIFPADSPFAGQGAAIGAQGAVTMLPSQAVDLKRNNIAAYIDLSTTPVKGWDIGVAGRFEHYDGSAGNVGVGKVTTRVELTPTLALRGTFSNGFRAPSLTQQGFASTARGYVVVNGVITGLSTTALVQPDSAIGQALGAKPLKPEHSINLSGGLSFNPSPRLTVTLDGYLIWLNNRISQTGNLFGAGVDAILASNGQATGQLISYYTNAIDTRTAGLDLVADYRHQIGRAKVNWTLGFNYNQTSITHIAATPAQLAGLGLTLFDRVAQGYITVGNPRTKVILTNNTTLGRFDTTLRLQRYGAVQLLTTGAVNDQYYGARIITDLEVGYRLSDRLHAAVGANNLLNIYPARSTIVDASGSSPYASNSPFGYYGGFYYARLSYKFGGGR